MLKSPVVIFLIAIFLKSRNNKNSEKSDAELVGLYKESGEPALLAELFQRYTHLVFGTCLKYLKDKEDSKDAVMQVFEKLISSLKDHEVNNFKSWLYVATRNHCLMQLRSGKNNKNYFEKIDESDVEFASPLHLTEDENDVLEIKLSSLEKSIEKLPEEQKVCIRLFFLEEKSYNQISLSTGYDLKKVKSYIQNGKRNLKMDLEKWT